MSTSNGNRKHTRKSVTTTVRMKITTKVPPTYMIGVMHSLAEEASHSSAKSHEVARLSLRMTVNDCVRVGGGVNVNVAVRVRSSVPVSV